MQQKATHFSHAIPPQTPPDQFSNPSDSLSSQLTQCSSPRNSQETEIHQVQSNPQIKRHNSNYQYRSQNNQTNHIRTRVQLTLIQEVNNNKSINNQCDFDDDSEASAPQEGNIGLRSSLIDYNSQNNKANTQDVYATKKTRAQMVPRSEPLAPVFKSMPGKTSSQVILQPQENNGLQFERLSNQNLPSQYQQNQYATEKVDFYGQNHQSQIIASPRNSANSVQANELNEGVQCLPQSYQPSPKNFGNSVSPRVLMQRSQKNFDFANTQNDMGSNIHPLKQNLVNNKNSPQNVQEQSNKPEPEIQPARIIAQPVERQIKYLGLVIEKDEEYDIASDDLDTMRLQKARGSISRFSANELERYDNEGPDDTRRQYFPIRDRYIKIVKNSRKLSIESFEKKGRKDLKQTCKSLIKVAKLQKRQNFEASLSNQMLDLDLQ